MSAKLFSALLLLAPAVFAQLPNDTITNRAELEITFSDPAASNCGRNGGGNEGNAVTFSLLSRPALFSCFNLNGTFLHPNVTYATPGYSCMYDVPCGANYTLSGWENFSGNVNYSQIAYTQRNPYSSDDDGDDDNDEKIGLFNFRTYSGPSCQQSGSSEMDGTGDDSTTYPWIQWNCRTDNTECSTIRYNVVSFAIVPVEEDQQGDDDCLVAATYGHSGAGRTTISMAALAVALISTVFCLV